LRTGARSEAVLSTVIAPAVGWGNAGSIAVSVTFAFV
jgi:hypothetical protein